MFIDFLCNIERIKLEQKVSVTLFLISKLNLFKVLSLKLYSKTH